MIELIIRNLMDILMEQFTPNPQASTGSNRWWVLESIGRRDDAMSVGWL